MERYEFVATTTNKEKMITVVFSVVMVFFFGRTSTSFILL